MGRTTNMNKVSLEIAEFKAVEVKFGTLKLTVQKLEYTEFTPMYQKATNAIRKYMTHKTAAKKALADRERHEQMLFASGAYGPMDIPEDATPEQVAEIRALNADQSVSAGVSTSAISDTSQAMSLSDESENEAFQALLNELEGIPGFALELVELTVRGLPADREFANEPWDVVAQLAKISIDVNFLDNAEIRSFFPGLTPGSEKGKQPGASKGKSKASGN